VENFGAPSHVAKLFQTKIKFLALNGYNSKTAKKVFIKRLQFGGAQ